MAGVPAAFTSSTIVSVLSWTSSRYATTLSLASFGLLVSRSSLPRSVLPDLTSFDQVLSAPQTSFAQVSASVPEELELLSSLPPPQPAAARASRTTEKASTILAASTPAILPVAEMVRVRERRDEIRRAGELACERRQRLELVDEDVLVLLDPFEDSPREDQWLASDDRPVLLVDLRRDDQVHLPVLVFEQHEDDPVRSRRALAGHGHPGHGHPRPVRCQAQVMAGKDTLREVRAHQLHRVDVDREARLAVVGEHLLPLGGLSELGRLRGRVERKSELPLVAARAGDAL